MYDEQMDNDVKMILIQKLSQMIMQSVNGKQVHPLLLEEVKQDGQPIIFIGSKLNFELSSEWNEDDGFQGYHITIYENGEEEVGKEARELINHYIWEIFSKLRNLMDIWFMFKEPDIEVNIYAYIDAIKSEHQCYLSIYLEERNYKNQNNQSLES